jgi:hypothetical protein
VLLTPLLSMVYLTTYSLHLVLSEKFHLREFQILLGKHSIILDLKFEFYNYFPRVEITMWNIQVM